LVCVCAIHHISTPLPPHENSQFYGRLTRKTNGKQVQSMDQPMDWMEIGGMNGRHNSLPRTPFQSHWTNVQLPSPLRRNGTIPSIPPGTVSLLIFPVLWIEPILFPMFSPLIWQ
jgi:hypothetical protein